MLVGADAERSCSRRRSVTDAACPLRVLIGPILRFCTARSFMGVGASIARPISFCAPILFFLFLRKKRTAAASEETRCIPFPAKAENFISAPFLFLSESRPLRWVAFRLILERKRTSKNGSAPVSPNCDPAQRSQFGKEEGASGYGAFAASAEAECSWLLLTPRRTLS